MLLLYFEIFSLCLQLLFPSTWFYTVDNDDALLPNWENNCEIGFHRSYYQEKVATNWYH